MGMHQVFLVSMGQHFQGCTAFFFFFFRGSNEEKERKKDGGFNNSNKEDGNEDVSVVAGTTG